MDAVWIDLNDAANAGAKAALWRILCAIDAEFLPPLSSRSDTTTRALELGRAASRGASPRPRAYFAQMLAQENVMIRDAGEWIGFMSIKPRHVDPAVAAHCPCDYISTLGALPAHRGRGVARRLYRAVIDDRERLPARMGAPWLVTRTWSTNDAHLALLGRLGFREILRLCDHRGVGIDSVYFALSV